MRFQQTAKLAFSSDIELPNDLYINENHIDVTTDYAGSYHIFEMGRHYVEYCNDDTTFPSFSVLPSFPPSTIFQQLNKKTRAGGVTGNIGEIVSGIVAKRTLGFKTKDIAHLKVLGNSRTPDYLLCKTQAFCNFLKSVGIATQAQCNQFPRFWLMESKAKTSGSINSNIKDAFRQIATCWFRMIGTYEKGIGYGIAIGTTLHRSSVTIHIFIPKNQNGFVTFLKSFPDKETFSKELKGKKIDNILSKFKDA